MDESKIHNIWWSSSTFCCTRFYVYLWYTGIFTLDQWYIYRDGHYCMLNFISYAKMVFQWHPYIFTFFYSDLSTFLVFRLSLFVCVLFTTFSTENSIPLRHFLIHCSWFFASANVWMIIHVILEFYIMFYMLHWWKVTLINKKGNEKQLFQLICWMTLPRYKYIEIL
jgi:hypothetical protein